MANKRITDLDPYGSVSGTTSKRKDLFEVSKNANTYGSPSYPSSPDSSRKVTAEEARAILEAEFIGNKVQTAGAVTDPAIQYPSVAYINSLGKGLFSGGVEKIVAVLSSPITTSDGLYVPLVITEADKNKYLSIETSTIGSVMWGGNLAFNLQFTGSFSNGFAIGIHVKTYGGCSTSLNGRFISSGKTYIFVYNSALSIWYVDEMQSFFDEAITYLPNYAGSGSTLLLTSTNHTYVYDFSASSDNNTPPYKPCSFISGSLWKDRHIKVLFGNNMSTSLSGPSFTCFSGDTILGEGSSWSPPIGTKAGSSVTFRSIGGGKIIIEDQTILI